MIFTFNKNISNAKKLCKDRKNIFYYKVNIKQKKSINNLFNFIKKKFNKLDVIVNNAGINNPTDFDKIKEKDWDNILAINLKGPFMIMQESLDLIKKSKNGSIINVSSVSGQYGGPRTAHYAASKAGLISLNQVAARFFLNTTLDVTHWCLVLYNQKWLKSTKIKKMKSVTSSILLNRQGTAKEVARGASLLLKKVAI